MAQILGKTKSDKSPTMKVVWSHRALRHLVYLSQHIEKDSGQNAAPVANRILKAAELLQRPSGN